MPSLLPDYEYDIFISYRQKENSYYGWVTEFVNNLRMNRRPLSRKTYPFTLMRIRDDLVQGNHIIDKDLEDKLRCIESYIQNVHFTLPTK